MSITQGPFDNQNLYQSLNVITSNVPKTHSRNKKRLLNLGDSIFSLFIIAPLVIAHWRGTWDGMDQYERIFPPVNCMIFGAILHSTFALLRQPLNNLESKKSYKTRVKIFLIKRLYTYFFSLGCIMHWRGGWAFAKEFEGRMKLK